MSGGLFGGRKGLAFRAGGSSVGSARPAARGGAEVRILICDNKQVAGVGFNPCSAGAEDRTVDYSIILSLGGSNKASQYAMAGAGEG